MSKVLVKEIHFDRSTLRFSMSRARRKQIKIIPPEDMKHHVTDEKDAFENPLLNK
jgi:hypothetical protein